MEYKSKYMADYYEQQAPKYFLVRREIITLIEYNVEAGSITDAIKLIENGDTSCIVDESEIGEEHNKKGRIISVVVNDNA